jgi:hypothetical protein
MVSLWTVILVFGAGYSCPLWGPLALYVASLLFFLSVATVRTCTSSQCRCSRANLRACVHDGVNAVIFSLMLFDLWIPPAFADVLVWARAKTVLESPQQRLAEHG